MIPAKALPAMLVAIAAAGAAVHGVLTRPRAQAPVVADAVVDDALGLRLGDRIAGWTVRGLAGGPDSELRIELERDDLRFTVTVTPMGARPENPPVHTEHYAIYYGHAQPSGTRIPEGAVRAITADVARRLAKR
ncbi:MAG TPA: hypothetical protein VFG69_18255 [Nannocystaceae bacterium]|nr:hypothetical protein [Nannocystaceae bacterium]